MSCSCCCYKNEEKNKEIENEMICNDEDRASKPCHVEDNNTKLEECQEKKKMQTFNQYSNKKDEEEKTTCQIEQQKRKTNGIDNEEEKKLKEKEEKELKQKILNKLESQLQDFGESKRTADRDDPVAIVRNGEVFRVSWLVSPKDLFSDEGKGLLLDIKFTKESLFDTDGIIFKLFEVFNETKINERKKINIDYTLMDGEKYDTLKIDTLKIAPNIKKNKNSSIEVAVVKSCGKKDRDISQEKFSFFISKNARDFFLSRFILIGFRKFFLSKKQEKDENYPTEFLEKKIDLEAFAPSGLMKWIRSQKEEKHQRLGWRFRQNGYGYHPVDKDSQEVVFTKDENGETPMINITSRVGKDKNTEVIQGDFQYFYEKEENDGTINLTFKNMVGKELKTFKIKQGRIIER